jgi:1-acyl-sn-glycerol-3-phosphate acyltransferase
VTDRQVIGTGHYLFWRVVHALWSALSFVVFRPRVSGLEHVPPTGAYLLLANHTSAFDTAWIVRPLWRPVHFMASASMFRRPVMGALLRSVNAFPKEVFTRDARSLDTVNRLIEQGQIVQIMPEGVRTWDGRLMDVRPGIGRLAISLGVPVVVAKTLTGHLIWPRWASWPRWVPLHIQYVVLDVTSAEPEQAWRDIVQAMTIPSCPKVTSTVLSFRTAEGLPEYLWACPVCFSLDALAAKGNRLACKACSDDWLVTVENRLVGDTSMDLPQAYDGIRAHFGAPPVADPSRMATEGVALASEMVVTHLPKGGQRREVARGRLRLSADGLTLGDQWSLAFADLKGLNTDVGNVVHLRVDDGRFQLDPVGPESTYKWENFIRAWWTASTLDVLRD